VFSHGSHETIKEYVQREATDCNYNNAGKKTQLDDVSLVKSSFALMSSVSDYIC